MCVCVCVCVRVCNGMNTCSFEVDNNAIYKPFQSFYELTHVLIVA